MSHLPQGSWKAAPGEAVGEAGGGAAPNGWNQRFLRKEEESITTRSWSKKPAVVLWLFSIFKGEYMPVSRLDKCCKQGLRVVVLYPKQPATHRWGWPPSCGAAHDHGVGRSLGVSFNQMPAAVKLQQQGLSMAGYQNMCPRSRAATCCYCTAVIILPLPPEPAPLNEAQRSPPMLQLHPRLRCGRGPCGRW